MKYNIFFSLCLLFNLSYSFAEVYIQDPPPNIIFIIADDMGKDATNGFLESKIKPKTPNLDTIKDNGLSFNNFWVTPTCSPTRATIITGKYGFKTGVLQPGDKLSSSETILQKHIAQTTNNTYATAVIGKWHLSGRDTSFNPENLGIDYFAGIMSGGVKDYYNWKLFENNVTTTQTTYITQKFTDLAINWVSKQDKPWFLWLAYNAPHTPFHNPPSSMHVQGELSEYSRNKNAIPYYMASIEAMDYQIGRLLKNLTPEVRENTIIIFIGDNGTPRRVSQAPYSRKAKGTLYQGGVNTPMFISGKGVIRKTEDNNLINSTDLFATISQIAGAKTSKINDSKSFMPLFKKSQCHRDYIYSETESHGEVSWTIRNKTYKIIENESEVVEMYNLIHDPYETANLLDGTLSKKETKAKNKLISMTDKMRQ